LLELQGVRVEDLSRYPELQRRANREEFDVSGIKHLIMEFKKEAMEELKEEFIHNGNDINLHQFMWLICHSLTLWNAESQGMSIEEQYYQY
jgi:hypothetical protein